jgi:flavin reductase (DIM6/NTAB) family NADH-FMN oxidoreductase RutF
MSASPGGVDPQVFRAVMGAVAAPVTIVTTDGPHGATVSSFTSLSLRPPMVLVALDRSSHLLDAVKGSRRFGVNILAGGQGDLALRFARKGTDKFVDTHWFTDDGLPRFPATAGWLACDLAEVLSGGDHEVLVGTVVGAAEEPSRPPLTYHRRTFGTHTPRPELGPPADRLPHAPGAPDGDVGRAVPDVYDWGD